MIYPQRTKLVSLPAEGVTFPMKAKCNFANRTVEGEEDHLAEMEEAFPPPEQGVDGPWPNPTPVENQCPNPMPGTTMSITVAGDLCCMTINNPNCENF